MSTATGEQFEITRGTARAVVTEIGAALRLFESDGVPYAETYSADEAPPLGCGNVLVPWPNRVAGARWTSDGIAQHLAVTEPARGNAIHGLVRTTRWRVVERAASLITLDTMIEPQQGWPFALHVSLGYELTDSGLTVTYRVENIGTAAAPFGVGMHPYIRAGNAATDECELRLSASTVLPLDPDSMIPSGPAQPAPSELDFRTPKRLAGFELDTPFGGCVPSEDGLIHHQLSAAHGGVELWADPDFRWVQVFTPSEFPGRGRAVAVEPMTCPPDALNSGIDLITLTPGGSWSARWGLRPTG
ncbi:MAG: aldose 1-epimerase family protein [Sciscionella sp.]